MSSALENMHSSSRLGLWKWMYNTVTLQAAAQIHHSFGAFAISLIAHIIIVWCGQAARKHDTCMQVVMQLASLHLSRESQHSHLHLPAVLLHEVGINTTGSAGLDRAGGAAVHARSVQHHQEQEWGGGLWGVHTHGLPQPRRAQRRLWHQVRSHQPAGPLCQE